MKTRCIFPVCSMVLAGVLLTACGFTPLYAGKTVSNTLSGVQVATPQGRIGELIREHLDDALAHNASSPTRYKMSLALGEQRYPRGIRIDNVATRYEYVLVAAYDLTDAASGAAVKSGKVRVEVTYDSADQPYASVAAQQDAQDRAAGEAARRIELELAAWLAGQPKG